MAHANEAPLGWVPGADDFDLEGLENFDSDQREEAQNIDLDEWRRELLPQDELCTKLCDHLPKELIFKCELLVARL